MTMHQVEIDEEDWDILQRAVAAGDYRDAREVVHAGLLALGLGDERELNPEMIAYINQRVEKGKAEIARGQYTRLESDEDVDAFFGAIEKRVSDCSDV